MEVGPLVMAVSMVPQSYLNGAQWNLNGLWLMLMRWDGTLPLYLVRRATAVIQASKPNLSHLIVAHNTILRTASSNHFD